LNNFIAIAVVLPILLFFVPQYALQIEVRHNISALEAIVETAKEEAAQEGMFTNTVINKMKNEIAAEFRDVSVSEIQADVTVTPKYRTDTFDHRELINYSVGVPIKKLTAANGFFGISDADNSTVFYIKGSVASERLP
jgi:hypothetical protein